MGRVCRGFRSDFGWAPVEAWARRSPITPPDREDISRALLRPWSLCACAAQYPGAVRTLLTGPVGVFSFKLDDFNFAALSMARAVLSHFDSLSPAGAAVLDLVGKQVAHSSVDLVGLDAPVQCDSCRQRFRDQKSLALHKKFICDTDRANSKLEGWARL